MRACAPYMGDLRPERVAVVLPFSNLFSVRNCAEQILVTVSRVLGYELKVPFQAVSEYELSTGMDYDVVIVPSPRILTDSCFAALSALAEKGAAIVLTGAYCQDEYFTTKTERLGRLSSTAEILPAQREEKLELDGAVYFASYSGDSLAFVDKAAPGRGRQCGRAGSQRQGPVDLVQPAPGAERQPRAAAGVLQLCARLRRLCERHRTGGVRAGRAAPQAEIFRNGRQPVRGGL